MDRNPSYSYLGDSSEHAEEISNLWVGNLNDCRGQDEGLGRVTHWRCRRRDHPNKLTNNTVHVILAELRAGKTLNQAEDAAQGARKVTRQNIVMASTYLELLVRPHDPLLWSATGSKRLAWIRTGVLVEPVRVARVVRECVLGDPELKSVIASKLAEMQSHFGPLELNADNAIRALILQGAQAQRSKKRKQNAQR